MNTTENFINKASTKHKNFYNYSKTIYNKSSEKVIIICPIHGEFEQTPNNHLSGGGCPTCAKLKRNNSYKKAIFLKKQNHNININNINNYNYIVINKDAVAIVDEEDYEKVLKYNWNISSKRYAFNKDVGLMHRFILNVTDSSVIVDHINHNELDNRKINLRLCTKKENCSNQLIQNNLNKSSIYKGVCWDKSRNKWLSKIKYNQKNIFIGRFDKEIDAAKVYDTKALILFKEFSHLNFET